MDQELGELRINFKNYPRTNQRFATATHDHQWIHTDPERAKVEGALWKHQSPHG